MATDPAVQAAHRAWRELANAMESYWDSPSIGETIDAVVAAVTPLIRAQAFAEAADVIDKWDWQGDYAVGSMGDVAEGAATLVRGLGEETENA